MENSTISEAQLNYKIPDNNLWNDWQHKSKNRKERSQEYRNNAKGIFRFLMVSANLLEPHAHKFVLISFICGQIYQY